MINLLKLYPPHLQRMVLGRSEWDRLFRKGNRLIAHEVTLAKRLAGA